MCTCMCVFVCVCICQPGGWYTVLASVSPDREHSLLYLMDVVAQFVFTDVSLLKHMQKALLESYFVRVICMCLQLHMYM